MTRRALVADYERALWETKTELRSTLADHRRLADDLENLRVKSNTLEDSAKSASDRKRRRTREVANQKEGERLRNWPPTRWCASVEADQKGLPPWSRPGKTKSRRSTTPESSATDRSCGASTPGSGERTIATGMVGVPFCRPTVRIRHGSNSSTRSTTRGRRSSRAEVQELSERPTISVLMPTYNPRSSSCARPSSRCGPRSTRTGSCASPTTARPTRGVRRPRENTRPPIRESKSFA